MLYLNQDLISIVIPVYNVEKYLERCLQSVVDQTYKDIEIILVDDGSTDESKIICDLYESNDSRIKVIHKENGGLSDARNAGIDIAKGKYISFIDSDDYVEKDYIKSMYDAIKKDNSDISVSLHVIKYENGKTKFKFENQCDKIVNAKQALEMMLYDDGLDLSAWGKLYKTVFFNNIKFPKGRIFEDAATTYKLMDKAEKISLVNQYLYNYMIRNNSISSGKFNEKKMDLISSTKEMSDFVSQKYPDLQRACDRRLMYAYLSTITQLAKSNEQKKYCDLKKELMTYIKKNGRKVLADKNIPKRDRVAIILCKFGYPVFRFAWKIYEKM